MKGILTIAAIAALSSSTKASPTGGVEKTELQLQAEQLGPVDIEALQKEIDRVTAKYARGAKNYQLNKAGKSFDIDLKNMARQLELDNKKANKTNFKRGLWPLGGSNTPGDSDSDSDSPLYFSNGNSTYTQNPAQVVSTEDNSYYSLAAFGSQGSSFSVLLDTGSSDIWIAERSSPTVHKKYNPSGSSTFRNISSPWYIQYGTGEAKGYTVADQIKFASYTVQNQGFALSETAVKTFEELPGDGMFGLGFSSISKSAKRTFIENLIAQKQISSPEFGMYIDPNNKASDICIGCSDNNKYKGSLNYVPVVVEGYWEVTMDGVTINNQLNPHTSCLVAIDTGTNQIFLPTNVTRSIYRQLGGTAVSDSIYAIPCNTKLNQFGFQFGGVSYSISLKDLNLGYASRDSSSCIFGIFSQDQQDPEGNNVGIVGAPLLRSVYTSYSYSVNGKSAVGFASVVDGASSGTPSSSATTSGSGSGSGSGSSSSAPAALSSSKTLPVTMFLTTVTLLAWALL